MKTCKHENCNGDCTRTECGGKCSDIPNCEIKKYKQALEEIEKIVLNCMAGGYKDEFTQEIFNKINEVLK